MTRVGTLLLLLNIKMVIKLKDNEMGWACSSHVMRRNACGNFVMKSEGKILFGRDRHRWETDVIMDLKGI